MSLDFETVFSTTAISQIASIRGEWQPKAGKAIHWDAKNSVKQSVCA